MKALLLTFALVVSAIAVAQTSPAKKSSNTADKPSQFNEDSIPNVQADSGTCYTMRSYIFRVRDGVQQLVGEKTCTSSQQFHATYIPARPQQVHLQSADFK